ncbi:class I adenylate-forming enzyme family protein [Amycolatopsis thermophila]|uniref:Fatty-acyl-CoA synthase n=1 Tax=Amycolatopsis thermophila TaxID=206084 RepID=A0ABU0ET31_9PSEU|nr:AMP-binding protein [Amycolatopsis thermophila]MDQ0378468.1 fatty-acyl-CoA synthase [Amycolatopsis thermophila]
MSRIFDALADAAGVPSAPGWLTGDRAITFAEMDRLSDRVAAGLLRRGIRHGDRIGVLGPTTPEWLVVYFAAAKIGAVVVGLSVRYRENELAHMLGDSGARLVVTVPAHDGVDFVALLERLRDRLPHLDTVVSFGDRSYDELSAEAGPPGEAKVAVAPDDPVMIIYTSGTTGTPKGAVLTHRGQLAAARAQARHMRLGEHDVLPVAVPLNHVSGITCCVLTALVARARAVLLPAFDPREVAGLFTRPGLTLWVGVPTMHTLLLNRPELESVDTSAVRLVVTGGANAEPALLDRLTTRFPNATVMNLYGLSETSGAVLMTAWDDDFETTVATVGHPLPDVEIRVAGPAGTDLPAGETGELLVRSPSLMAGYHGRPRETAETLAGGWLRTGDMACVTGNGAVRLRGRAKEMFVQGGFNVYPVEVENVLAAHPDVVLAAGIGVPDPVLGEIGRYYVVLAPGATTTAEELTAFCAGKIADYKVPKEIVVRDSLPLTPAGKIQKSRLLNEGGDRRR